MKIKIKEKEWYDMLGDLDNPFKYFSYKTSRNYQGSLERYKCLVDTSEIFTKALEKYNKEDLSYYYHTSNNIELYEIDEIDFANDYDLEYKGKKIYREDYPEFYEKLDSLIQKEIDNVSESIIELEAEGYEQGDRYTFYFIPNDIEDTDRIQYALEKIFVITYYNVELLDDNDKVIFSEGIVSELYEVEKDALEFCRECYKGDIPDDIEIKIEYIY